MARKSKKKVAGGVGVALVLIIAIVAVVWIYMDEEEVVVDYSAMCEDAEVMISSAEFTASNFAKITVKGKGDTAKDIDGVMVTLTDADGNSFEDYILGGLANFESKMKEIHNIGFTPIKAEASVYFEDDEEKNVCSESVSKVFKGVNECTANGYKCMVEASCGGTIMSLEGCSSNQVCCMN